MAQRITVLRQLRRRPDLHLRRLGAGPGRDHRRRGRRHRQRARGGGGQPARHERPGEHRQGVHRRLLLRGPHGAGDARDRAPRTRPSPGSTGSSSAATSPAGPRSWRSSRARQRTRRPRPPSPRSRPGVWEIALASVAVAPAAASIVDANITDERGPRATGTDIENLSTTLLDPTSGHRHEGTAGTGRKVRHADLDGLTTDNHHAKSHTHSGDGSGIGRPRGDDGPDRDRPPPSAGGRSRRERHGRRRGRRRARPARSPARRTATRWRRRARRQPTWRPREAQARPVRWREPGTSTPTARATCPTPTTRRSTPSTRTRAPPTTSTPGRRRSAGGGAAGVKVWVGTTDPGGVGRRGRHLGQEVGRGG